MSKKNTKSLNAEIFDSIRKPMAPASTVMKNKKDKRKKKFDYKKELEKY